MAYSQPTIELFKLKFSVFNAVDNAVVELFLNEAIDHVGPLWTDKDRANAQMYYCAHLLASQGYNGAQIEVESGAVNGDTSSVPIAGSVRRHKVGDVEVEFQENNVSLASSGASEGGGNGVLDLSATIYGQVYLRLLRLNHPAVAVV